MSVQTICMLLLSVSFGSVGQYFFKTGMMGEKPTLGPSVVMMLFKPAVFTGLIFYALATLLWLVILSNNRLSLVYPFISISYIVVVFMGKYVFKEEVSVTTWIGVAVICAGVVLLGIGGQQSKDHRGQPEPPPSTASP